MSNTKRNNFWLLTGRTPYFNEDEFSKLIHLNGISDNHACFYWIKWKGIRYNKIVWSTLN